MDHIEYFYKNQKYNVNVALTNISMISVLPPAAARCSGDLCGGPVLEGGRKISTTAGKYL